MLGDPWKGMSSTPSSTGPLAAEDRMVSQVCNSQMRLKRYFAEAGRGMHVGSPVLSESCTVSYPLSGDIVKWKASVERGSDCL